MKKRHFIWVLLCLLLALSACGSAAAQKTAEKPEEHRIRIGFTPGSMGNPYTQEFYACMQESCAALDIGLTCFDADNDVAKQLRAIQSWVADGYDAVICSPIEPTTLQPVIDQCMESGIPFLNVDSECQRKTAFIGVNQYEYGYTAGKLAADWLNANYSGAEPVACAILTKPQSLAVIDRANGIIEGLQENCAFAQIVSTQPYSDQTSAQETTVQMLRQTPQIRCIVGVSDMSILGAYDALAELGLLDELFCLVGIDASAPVLEKIMEDTVIRGSVSQDTKGFAEKTIQSALAAIRGEPIPESSIRIEAVTIENAADYLRAGSAQ